MPTVLYKPEEGPHFTKSLFIELKNLFSSLFVPVMIGTLDKAPFVNDSSMPPFKIT